jgi:Putative transposase
MTYTIWHLPTSGNHLEGFSLHAGVHLHANDREGLARLCGYGARPALSEDQLSELPDGRLAIRMKRPLADGRQDLQLEPVDLLLAAASGQKSSYGTRTRGLNFLL